MDGCSGKRDIASDGDRSKFEIVDCLVFRVKDHDSKRRAVESAWLLLCSAACIIAELDSASFGVQSSSLLSLSA